jgi:hypothetical protein
MSTLCNIVMRFFFLFYFYELKKKYILVKLSPAVHVITVEPFAIKGFLRRTIQNLKGIDIYKKMHFLIIIQRRLLKGLT